MEMGPPTEDLAYSKVYWSMSLLSRVMEEKEFTPNEWMRRFAPAKLALEQDARWRRTFQERAPSALRDHEHPRAGSCHRTRLYPHSRTLGFPARNRTYSATIGRESQCV